MVTPGRPPMSPQAQAQAEKAKFLVMLSRIFGWGGIGMIFLMAPMAAGALRSGTLGVILVGLGLASAIAGGVLGQVGRAMQGRVI